MLPCKQISLHDSTHHRNRANKSTFHFSASNREQKNRKNFKNGKRINLFLTIIKNKCTGNLFSLYGVKVSILCKLQNQLKKLRIDIILLYSFLLKKVLFNCLTSQVIFLKLFDIQFSTFFILISFKNKQKQVE